MLDRYVFRYKEFFVHKNIFDEFLSIFEKNLKPLKIGNPLDNTTEIGPLIRPSEVEKGSRMG